MFRIESSWEDASERFCAQVVQALVEHPSIRSEWDVCAEASIVHGTLSSAKAPVVTNDVCNNHFQPFFFKLLQATVRYEGQGGILPSIA